MKFNDRYQVSLASLNKCCQAAGRDSAEVRIIAVSKTVGIPEVLEAVSAGVHDFAENRPELLKEKASEFPNETWHFIGNIQSRRIPEIVEHASLIHSLYQPSHVAKIDAAAQAVGKVQDVLLEVNISGEASKSGLKPQEVKDLLSLCESYEHIRVRGLMTMAPQGDRSAAQACFDELALLKNSLKDMMNSSKGDNFNELSMGMSDDWLEAVVAGATMVRIGRALFSDTF